MNDLHAAITRRGDRCIAVNAAGYDAPWADLLLFTDADFHDRHWQMVTAFRGEAWTVSRRVAQDFPDIGRAVVGPQGMLGAGGEVLPPSGSTGQTALAVAIHLGAERVGLLGFDLGPGADFRQHYHQHYLPGEALFLSPNARSLLSGWGDQAKRLGVDVVNFSPGSATDEFRKAPVARALAEQPFEPLYRSPGSATA